jgi:hypothetical protein
LAENNNYLTTLLKPYKGGIIMGFELKVRWKEAVVKYFED